jgi:outer membrane protein assembly factor BamB
MARRFALAGIIAILAAGTAKAQMLYSRELLPTRTALARLGLEQQWMGYVGLIGAERLLSISVAGNLFFAQTNRANLHVYDAETGRELWMVNMGRRSATAQAASANSRLVFVTNATQLYAIDKQTGRFVWSADLHFLPTSATICDEQQVMVGLSNGKLASYVLYDPNDRRKVLYGEPREWWNWQTGRGALTSRPLPAQQFVAFAGQDGKLYVALSALPTDMIPVMLYRIATGGEIAAPLGAYGTRTILVPSGDNNVYAVDLFEASVKWIYPSGAPVMQEPLVAGDDVYVVNTAGLFTSLDARNGTQHWTTSTHGGRLMSVSPKRVYLESYDDDLFIVDRATGQMLADPRATAQRAGLNLREYTVGLTNNLNDRLYMATPSGLIICLREMGQTQPRLLRDPKAPPFGYIPPEGALPRTGGAAPPETTPPAGETPAPAPTPEPAPAQEATPTPAPAPAQEAGAAAPAVPPQEAGAPQRNP